MSSINICTHFPCADNSARYAKTTFHAGLPNARPFFRCLNLKQVTTCSDKGYIKLLKTETVAVDIAVPHISPIHRIFFNRVCIFF